MASNTEQEAMPIAVVGLGCRFPGGSSSGEKFWDLLVNKKSGKKEVPSDRFNVDSFYHPHGERNGAVSITGHLGLFTFIF